MTHECTGRGNTDLGRLFVLPVMALLAVMNVASVAEEWAAPDRGPALRAVGLVRGLLLVAMYAMIVAFYILRSQARATGGSVRARAAAVLATFLPFAIAPLVDVRAGVGWVCASSILLFAGLAWSVWALRHLGRSLSIVAQARRLVRSGPYGMVRHPLYLGELVSVAGMVVGGFTWLSASLFGLLIVLQLDRAAREEKVLGATFPEYDEYRARTPRIVPKLGGAAAPAPLAPARS